MLLVPLVTLVMMWALTTWVTLGPGLNLLDAQNNLDNVGKPSQALIAELQAERKLSFGYIATGLKVVRDCQVGDTITLAARPATEPLPGYRPAKPMVFAGLYPVVSEEFPLLRDALERLSWASS